MNQNETDKPENDPIWLNEQKITAGIPYAMYKDIEARAKWDGVSVDDLIIDLLREGLSRIRP